MTDTERNEALHRVFEEMLGHRVENPDFPSLPPIDIQQHNEHSRKAEFIEEQCAVRECIDNIGRIILVIAGVKVDDAEDEPANMRLRDWLDYSASLSVDANPAPIEEIDMLLLHAAKVSGFSQTSIAFLTELREQLIKRNAMLDEQEAEYWSDQHRPGNHFARTIALRTAKVYAAELGRLPTLGTSRDGGHPNTAFGKALEQIFDILDIKSGVRSPAKWAIAQLTDSDLEPDKRSPHGKALDEHLLTKRLRIARRSDQKK